MSTAESSVPPRVRKQLVWFVALAYVFSWAWWVPMAISGTVTRAGQGWPTHLPGLLGPALAAVVVTGVGKGRPGLTRLWKRVTRWKVGWVWYGLIAATAALALIPLVAKSNVTVRESTLYSGAPAAGMLAVVYVIVVNGFGEEIGWRGFLADRLLDFISPGRTALVVWVVWATWHLPLFWVVANFRDFGVAGTVGWVVGIGFGSVFLTWLYQSAGRSVLIVALWHIAYNFTTATEASEGAAAAVSSTVVIVAGVAILRRTSTWTRPGSRPTTDLAATTALHTPAGDP